MGTLWSATAQAVAFQPALKIITVARRVEPTVLKSGDSGRRTPNLRPIIVQSAVPVLEGDTPDTLAARVFEAECEAYPEAIQLFADGRLEIEEGRLKTLECGGSTPPSIHLK